MGHSAEPNTNVLSTSSHAPPRFIPAMLPDANRTEMDFLDTTFFKENKSLPTPAQVRALSTSTGSGLRPPPVNSDIKLNLIVKFGPEIKVVEAICLWAVRRILGDKVPVPEVYGWRIDDGMVFIYMQWIQGDLLSDRWDSLNDSEKTAVCDQLHGIVTALGDFEQDPSDPFIGSITRGHLPDYVFQHKPPGGPFTSVREFHDWFSWLPRSWLAEPDKYENPYREYLPDDAEIRFAHADLPRNNILISRTSPPKVIAVIDWEQAGWYPDYWEYCKACYTSWHGGQWRNRWMPRFLTPLPDELLLWGEYINWMGAV